MIKCECGHYMKRNLVEETYDGEISLYCEKCHFEHFKAEKYFREEELSDIKIFPVIYLYNERFDNGKDVFVSITSDEIINGGYFEYWSKKLEDKGDYEKITHKNCIEDFKLIYGAWELTPEGIFHRE